MGAYFDPEVETASPERLREIQFLKLRENLEAINGGNSFYQGKFQEHGIEIGEIKTLDDLVRLPFSYKREYQQDQDENPPFGSNFSEPLSHFTRYHQTTGTTGRPLKWLETPESWQWRRRVAAMALWSAGVRQADIVFFPFSFGPHVAFWGLFEGAQDIGSLTISGGGWDTQQRIKGIMENQVTVICCTPTYALRIAEVAKESGVDLKESSVRLLVQGGEPGALVPSVRKRIKETMGATPYDYSGLTEIGAYGFQCREQDQAIHVNESEFIIEIIDPETGRPVPEGEMGEMVLTNLGRPCAPSIRFRTGDLVRFKRGACPCGRTFRMLDGGVLGRSDEMIVIRGINIFPSQVGEVVAKHLLIGEEYQLVAFTRDGMGEMKVLVELLEDRKGEEVTGALKEALRQRFEIRMEVEVIPPATLQRSEYKSKRFVDKRNEA